MFHKLFSKEKKQPSKDKRHRRRVIHKKGLSYVCKMTYTRFYPHYPQKITENSRAGKRGFGTGVLWIMFRGKKKIEKCRTKWINEIVRKQFGLQNKKMELLQNSSIVWYNVHTIIQRKDDEYEIYYRW